MCQLIRRPIFCSKADNIPVRWMSQTPVPCVIRSWTSSALLLVCHRLMGVYIVFNNQVVIMRQFETTAFHNTYKAKHGSPSMLETRPDLKIHNAINWTHKWTWHLGKKKIDTDINFTQEWLHWVNSNGTKFWWFLKKHNCVGFYRVAVYNWQASC